MNAVSTLVNLTRSLLGRSPAGGADQEVPAPQPQVNDVILTHYEHDGKEHSLPSVVTEVKENGDFTACVLMNDGDDPQAMNDEPGNWEPPQTGLNLGNMHTDPKKGDWAHLPSGVSASERSRLAFFLDKQTEHVKRMNSNESQAIVVTGQYPTPKTREDFQRGWLKIQLGMGGAEGPSVKGVMFDDTKQSDVQDIEGLKRLLDEIAAGKKEKKRPRDDDQDTRAKPPAAPATQFQQGTKRQGADGRSWWHVVPAQHGSSRWEEEAEEEAAAEEEEIRESARRSLSSLAQQQWRR